MNLYLLPYAYIYLYISIYLPLYLVPVCVRSFERTIESFITIWLRFLPANLPPATTVVGFTSLLLMRPSCHYRDVVFIRNVKRLTFTGIPEHAVILQQALHPPRTSTYSLPPLSHTSVITLCHPPSYQIFEISGSKSTCSCICLSISSSSINCSVDLSFQSPFYRLTFVSVRPSVLLSVLPSVCLSVCMSVRPSVCVITIRIWYRQSTNNNPPPIPVSLVCGLRTQLEDRPKTETVHDHKQQTLNWFLTS